MSKRITMISFMNKTELDKVEKLMNNIQIKTCKVPYGINDENRYNIDNLPYHFTIFATNKENQKEIITASAVFPEACASGKFFWKFFAR